MINMTPSPIMTMIKTTPSPMTSAKDHPANWAPDMASHVQNCDSTGDPTCDACCKGMDMPPAKATA
jgi:hypothetical protein